MIPGLGNKEPRRNRPRNHKCAHNLQHFAKILLFVVVLADVAVCFDKVGEEDLDEPGAEFSSGGGDAVACAAVTGGEDFGGDLRVLVSGIAGDVGE